MEDSPLFYRRGRSGWELTIAATHWYLLFKVLVDVGTPAVRQLLFVHFVDDPAGKTKAEVTYFARVLGEVIQKGGSAQFTLDGKPCQIFHDEGWVVLQIGALRVDSIRLRISEAKMIQAYCQDYFDESLNMR